MMLEEEKELLEEEKELLEERVRELTVQLEQTHSTKVGPGGPVVCITVYTDLLFLCTTVSGR